MAVGQDDRTQAAVRAAIAASGWELIAARDLDDATEAISRGLIDALLIDLENASEDDSFDLVQLMGVFLCVPTVVLMDKFAPSVAMELVKLGAQDVRLKSEIEGGWLVAAIDCALSRAQMARYDTLTGLPNRGLLFDRLNYAISQARRYDHQLAVLFIDLDRFKFVNDTMGHEAGDALLKAIAGRLRECLRESDTVARLGGDEFIGILTNLTDGIAVTTVAEKLVEQLSAPVTIGGHQVTVSPSIGIALYPSDATSSEQLVKLADVAMYQAKQTGGSGYQFYRPDLNSDALRRIGLGVALQRAIRGQELELHYQPQIDIIEGRVVGVEALVRWRHPERGLVAPDQFVPLAEELGLMVPMGDWILEEACRQLREWREQGLSSLRMAVNMSAHQFNRDSLLDHVLQWIDQYGLQRSCVELELTESSVMRDPEATARTLEALSAAGVGVAIDDFGTGYSSLAYLKRFPLDVLKIDGSFVRDVTTDENDAAIVKTIIGLAQHFGLNVVAEGVETIEHLEFLRRNGCRYMQGYYFARPMPAADIPGAVADIATRYQQRASAGL